MKDSGERYLKSRKRLKKLESSNKVGNDTTADDIQPSEISSLSHEEWSKQLEKKVMERLNEMNERFEKKFQENEATTVKLIEACEDRMLDKFNKSLEAKLNTQFDMVLGQITATIKNQISTAMSPYVKGEMGHGGNGQ